MMRRRMIYGTRAQAPVIGALLMTFISIMVFGVLYNAYNYLGQLIAREWSNKQEDIVRERDLDIVWIGPGHDNKLSIYLKNLSENDLTDLTIDVGGDLESVKRIDTGQVLERGVTKSIPLCDKEGWCLELEPGKHIIHVSSAQGVEYREDLVLDLVNLNLTDLTVETKTTT
ncbi:MAG: hypothetical protein QF415_05520 [Candidatus Undinarchaeales archaeon]|jgi:hypothetical protein|nr:hypothetical protein [Candidatus Undinarchaeales archaeon]MDP7493146.1 hypothetical protein [Candidatus Undinarchaeales archaeon]